MYLKFPFYPIVKSKIAAFLVLFSLVILMPLLGANEAESKDEVFIFKHETTTRFGNNTWNAIYLEQYGFNFWACIPNYLGSVIQDEASYCAGRIQKDEYLIITWRNPLIIPPKTSHKFAEIIHNNDANYLANPVACKKGAKFAVDLIPLNPEKGDRFWRIFLTHNDFIIQMGTKDSNEARRLFFFESLFLFPEAEEENESGLTRNTWQ